MSSSPSLRRSKRQRRITAGGKAPPPPPPPPANNEHQALRLVARAAAAEPDPLKEERLDLVWQEYLCPDQPAVWAFLKAALPISMCMVMRHFHPAEVFPAHYPNNLPPCMPQLPPLQQQQQQAQHAQAQCAQQLVPAADAAAAQGHPADGQRHVQQGQGDAAAAGSADSSNQASGNMTDSDGWGSGSSWGSGGSWASSGGGCMCSACCAMPACLRCFGGGFTPDSPRMQPGKRIAWRGAVKPKDPVRRNLLPAMLREAVACSVAFAEVDDDAGAAVPTPDPVCTAGAAGADIAAPRLAATRTLRSGCRL